MNFLIFTDFYGFFLNYFWFLKIKNDFKNDKKGVNIHAGHVDAMWYSGPRGSAMQAHASACVARRWHVGIIYIYIYIDHSRYSLVIIGRDLLTL